jgi:hypothetical protein
MWTRANFAKELVPGHFAVAIDTYRNKRAESMWKDMCTQKTSKKAKETSPERSGLGTLRVKGEGAPITFDTQIAGAEQTWIPSVMALGVRITEEAIDDNLYELNGGGEGKLKELFDDLGAAASENEETLMARFLVNGAATTYHTTRSSKALFATDHPRLDGSTFSNKATSTDLTYTSFWLAVVAAENQYNHRQYKIRKKIKNLWFPPQMERQATEVLKSSDRPDTANRAINAMASSGRKIGQKNWSYLTDTDAWYLQLDGTGVIRFNLRKTRFAKDGDFLTGDTMVKVDQRWSAEIDQPSDWYGVVPA